MKFTLDNKAFELAKTRRGAALLEKYLPGWRGLANVDYCTLGNLIQRGCVTDPGIIEALLHDVNAPAETVDPESRSHRSLDEVERPSYFPDGIVQPAPAQGEALRCILKTCEPEKKLVSPDGRCADIVSSRKTLSLNGDWEMFFDRDGAMDPAHSIPARVPGSVHTALFEAGEIPDPVFGRNQEIARRYSYMDWWFRTVFSADDLAARARLVFEGICNRCEIYLNGEKISEHEGMFGGPFIDVSGKLNPENELVVRLFAIPFHRQPGPAKDPERSADFIDDSWKSTVVFNNVYGWHYSCMPALGIWNSVRLEYLPEIEIRDPFVVTIDEKTAKVRVRTDYAASKAFSGALSVNVAPDNFRGESFGVSIPVHGETEGSFLLEFDVPQARIWWPNGMGEQNLYRLTLALETEDCMSERVQTCFGIRTLRMEPLADGPREDIYNWRFTINGKSAFMGGTGWCTADACMDFSRERYERFLGMAKRQNCRMVRAWGSGMPETADFYDICDRYGLLVMLEWPTAWNSHLEQPYELLEETVRLNTLRIRNHPSLALYCPGNESGTPYGEAIDMMGCYAVTLDGTRAFHRGEPFGGSIHNHDAYWARVSLDVAANLEAAFFGEFGIACLPDYESVCRYLPEEEKNIWPERPFSAFEYHTPIFGSSGELSRLKQVAGYFAHEETTLEESCVASQLTQIVAVRHLLERSRIRYPDCGGALYYKLNDNFPAMSWASVDWYGAPKLAHYVVQKSFAPAAALILTDKTNFKGFVHTLPVYVMDENSAENAQYEVRATICNGALKRLKELHFNCKGDVSQAVRVGTIQQSYEDGCEPPLLIRLELLKDSRKIFDTFYFYNFDAKPGCMFDLPRTNLRLFTNKGHALIENCGEVPAIGAMVRRDGHSDSFIAEENFLWLEPGEMREIEVNTIEGISAWALNA